MSIIQQVSKMPSRQALHVASLKRELREIDGAIHEYRAEGDMLMVKCVLERKRELRAMIGRIALSKRKPKVTTGRRPRRRQRIQELYDNQWEDEEEEPSERSESPEPEDEGPPDGGEDVDEDEENVEEPLFRERDRGEETTLEEQVYVKFRTDVAVTELIGGLLVLKICHKMNWKVFLAMIKLVEAFLVTDQKVLPKNYTQLKKFFARVHGVEAKRVTYCVDCEEILKVLPQMTDRPAGLVCSRCQRDVSSDVKMGIGTFIYLPLLPQLRSYVEKSDLYQFIRVVADEVLNIFRGERFKGVLQRGNIPIMIGSDAAPITKSGSKSVYPIVLSLGNLPYRVTHRFTMLSAVFAGKRENEPPPNVFYDLLREELQGFKDKPIKWSETEAKAIEVTAVGGDAPEMRKLANQCTSGYRSCVYCLTHGIFHAGHVRFGLKLHERPQRERTPQHRYECAKKADVKNKEARVFKGRQYRKNGILGYPLFIESASFHGTKSLVVDMMHVVLLGFLKDLVVDMCKGCSLNHHLQRSAAQGFTCKYATNKILPKKLTSIFRSQCEKMSEFINTNNCCS
jgi:hypothetical protein